ncbi:MAG: carbon-nitrogen hydrolase [Tannerellaceae bacterium]|jgi:N-carbamoylputrescine amidase|nr:carbon-nitrogen hydrolase [Tannerellaceae bacterium]
MKVGIIQQANTCDIATNIEKLRKHIIMCAREGADLVVLPELHNGLYFCQTEDTAVFDQAETIPGPSTRRFGELAKEYGLVLVLSLFEKRAPGLYHNTAVVLDKDGSIAGIYRKMHIPDDPAYYEKFYFTPGDLGFRPIPASVGSLGVLVCWDQWFPEAARLMAMHGAEILIYPTAIGWESSDTEEEKSRQRDAWQTIQRAHAVANGLPVVAVNRVGYEPDPSGRTGGIRFWGSSFAAGPQGELLTQLPDGSEEVRVVDIDPARSENVRRWWPFFRDRRIDAYHGLSERFLD